MKSIIAVALVTLAVSSCSLFGNKNNSNNSNNTNLPKPPTVKERFMGTWEVAPESTSDFHGGPITFNDDGSYTALKTTKASSGTYSGKFEIKDDKLFLDGKLKSFTSEGFSLETDKRMKLLRKGKTIYFLKK